MWCRFRRDPGYEAEDVIGTLAYRAPGRVLIVSGDRDLFQLVQDPSDGLPGVSGIGDKTAAGLVSRPGDFDPIMTAAQGPRRIPRLRR